MKKILFLIAFFIPSLAFCSTIQIKDGLYYSYWVYNDGRTIKEYPMLTNHPRKEVGKYILTPVSDLSAANEIYIQVKKNIPVLYFYHENVGADLDTIGWAGAKFMERNMVISANTIRLVKNNTKDHVFVGEKFDGKIVSLEKEEIAPIELINDEEFKVDCNKYFAVNNYNENGLPDYVGLEPTERKGVFIGYPATVFAVGDTGICSVFLDEGVVPQIKNGWIQFRRLD